MNSTSRYVDFALCREMLETPDVVRRFVLPTDARCASDRILLTGEGSSRIFPAKRAIAHARRNGWPIRVETEAALQAAEYDLSGYHVYVASNSGKTAEGVHLIRALRAVAAAAGATAARGVARITGVVANAGTPIATEADGAVILGCGPEDAVAASKSVVEQALVYDALLREAAGDEPVDVDTLAAAVEAALTAPIDPAIVQRVAAAPTIYFAGWNDGAAEELTLKTNEITRKRASFLEGTYALHGIEEVMNADEAVVLIEPYPELEERFDRVLRAGVGLEVVAIASRQTRFPTIVIPAAGREAGVAASSWDTAPYAQLAAGWNLLVELGLALGVNMDKTERARKVGNEFTPAG